MSKRLLSTLLLTILITGGIWWQIGRSPKKPTLSPAEELAQKIGQALDHPDTSPASKDFERLRALLRQDPENDHLRLTQARINWMTGNLDDLISAKNKLLELSKGSGPISLKALKAIAFSPLREGVFKEDVEDAAGKLRKHPLAENTEILRSTEILLHLAKPADRDSILNAVIHQVQYKDKPLLARW